MSGYLPGRALEPALWAITITAIAVTAVEVAHLAAHPRVPAPAIWASADMSWPMHRDSLDDAAARIVEHDPFRVERRPPDVAFGTQAGGTSASTAAPAKPQLTVSGIVGGPPWAALLNGVPGHEGTVLVHAGDALSGFTVLAVHAASLTISGMDTTWHLTVNDPWH
jgi:hypothetical protein